MTGESSLLLNSVDMQRFNSDGIEVAYFDVGEGEPILLIHGFGTTAKLNWIEGGWVDELIANKRRVVALDNRGHGDSEKLYEPDGYGMVDAAKDSLRLLDHLAIDQADVMGYSMGSRIAALLAVDRPKRVRSLILGGIGENLIAGQEAGHEVAEALEADSLDDVTNERGRLFRKFIDRTGEDLRALAACMRAPREPVSAKALAELQLPILLAIGTLDTIAGPISDLAAHIPQAKLYGIEDRDHMRAVRDAAYIQAVVAFLKERP